LPLFGLALIPVLVFSIPWIIVQSHKFQRTWLADNGIAATRFDDILCRMLADNAAGPEGAERYLATHPDINERARCTDASAPPSRR